MNKDKYIMNGRCENWGILKNNIMIRSLRITGKVSVHYNLIVESAEEAVWLN